jgi:hypothetical protein
MANRMQSTTQSSTAASHDAVIRVYDEAGNVVETHEHKDESLAEYLPRHPAVAYVYLVGQTTHIT